jgi:hypothetical protein
LVFNSSHEGSRSPFDTLTENNFNSSAATPPPFWVSLSNPGEGIAGIAPWSSILRFDRLTVNGWFFSFES